ncbi:MAG TPA: phospho-N-acetylmuramoyl-pentapeptide-transferase [Firmicutes bacterium]|nr:phospho-N-acetylmuramoyl-pentapeptide-transferase [Bacillota bacterium]
MLGVLAFVSALLIVLILGPVMIPSLKKLKMGQKVRDDGPASHKIKEGTPTMGGILILAGLVPASLFFGRLASEQRIQPGKFEVLISLLILVLGYAAMGFTDDYIKVVRRRSLGLRARQKLLLQTLFAAVIVITAQRLGMGTHVTVPYTFTQIDLGAAAYSMFALLVIIGSANAVNLTDGLDGLAAGTAGIAFAVYWLIASVAGRTELAIFCGSAAGACFGFLKFNSYPAKVFMGDTGSLALGSALGGLAILTKTELVLPIVGFVFVIETLSVIIQVLSFRLTGRRVFRMSPLHHHFELCGFKEKSIVTCFYVVGILAAVAALMGLSGL